MKLLSPTISKLVRLRYSRIEEWMNNPITAQREILQDLVTHGQHTAFGRKYGLKEMFSIRMFKQQIPIHEYEDLKPYIDRLMEGDENMLWNTPVNWFAKSSGTTSDKSKFIPVTEESLEDCHFQAGKDVYGEIPLSYDLSITSKSIDSIDWVKRINMLTFLIPTTLQSLPSHY